MEKEKKAILAGGCFWCMIHPFEELPGVKKVVSGYTGGVGSDPTYGDYAEKGHVEAIEVTYDPQKVAYEKLLYIFWHQVNPTDSGGQFCDRGSQYRSVIFYADEEQRRAAVESKKKLEESGRFATALATEILPASRFYPAEDYHQDYYKKNPLRYKFYRFSCGRDQTLAKIWK